MLLLRDFFRVPPIELPTSAVAFSLSNDFLAGDPPPIDFRVRRVAGSVFSACDAILAPRACDYVRDDCGGHELV